MYKVQYIKLLTIYLIIIICIGVLINCTSHVFTFYTLFTRNLYVIGNLEGEDDRLPIRSYKHSSVRFLVQATQSLLFKKVSPFGSKLTSRGYHFSYILSDEGNYLSVGLRCTWLNIQKSHILLMPLSAVESAWHKLLEIYFL